MEEYTILHSVWAKAAEMKEREFIREVYYPDAQPVDVHKGFYFVPDDPRRGTNEAAFARAFPTPLLAPPPCPWLPSVSDQRKHHKRLEQVRTAHVHRA